MIRVFHLFLILVFGSIVSSAFADQPTDIAALVHQADEKKLAYHPYWMALMHYRHNAFFNRDAIVSEVISPDFFLSPQGAADSDAELAATLRAFFDDPGKDPDNHAQCRFIARYKWLRKSLDWGSLKPPSVTCKQFDEWSMNGHVDSLSLVFATGYLSNPASFYGHILLKFNTQREIEPTDLLDESINYGAIVPKNENGLVYIVKGLFGGYDAGFSHDRFYRENHIYAENELRDMWEYELDLTKDEVDQVAAHTWELSRKKFVYYFLKENCAYSMAELLNLVIDKPLLPTALPWSIPATVFNRLTSLERNGAPIVRKVRRIPSRLNAFYEKYSALTAAQQHLVKELVDTALSFDKTSYPELSEAEKIAIVDALLDYYEFRIVGDKKTPEFRVAKQKLLIERSGLASQSPLAINDFSHSSAASPPHQGSRPGMIRLGLLHNSRLGPGVELRFRPAYFDFLELDAGRIANSNLTMFDVRAVYANDRLKLRSLDLVNIETLNVSRTGLPGDGGLAWKVKFGLESQDLGCIDCMIFNLTGGIGKAATITSRLTAFGMLDGFAQTERRNSGTIGVTPRIGLIGSPVVGWKSHFTLGRRTYINGSRSSSWLIRWENRFGSSRDWDVRITYEEQIEREFQAAVSFYW